MKITGRMFVWACASMVTAAIGCGGNDGLSTHGADGGAGAGGSSAGTAGASAGSAGASTGTAGASTGSAGAGTCGAVQPCGGNVVGSWKIVSACFIKDASLDASDICATASIRLTSVSAMGTIDYSAAGTYQANGTIAIGFQLAVPLSCFVTGDTCADLDASFAQEMQQDMTITSHSCAVSASSCVCTIGALQSNESGTYSTSGSVLTTTPTGGDASNDSYCVQGNTLHDLAVDMSMQTSMGMAKVQGDIVYTKQ
jgi:hypothetical protein